MMYPTLTAATLLLIAGTALGQPVLDGKIDAADAALYGAAKWLQTNPTGFGDSNPGSQPPCFPVGNGIRIAINNSNTAGVGGAAPNAADQIAAAAVTTGIEFAIPFSQINDPTGDIRIITYINGGGYDYLSNQFLPGFAAPQGNLGGNGTGGFIGGASPLGQINLNNFAGTQFATIPNIVSAATAPTIDGTLDVSSYGAPITVQTVDTGFGNSTLGQTGFANGSELNALYAQVREADLGDGPQTYLFVFVSGNVETNFNKFNMWIDSQAGGQNVVRNDNSGAEGLNTHNGMTFDSGFEADYYISFRGGGGSPDWFADFSQVLTNGGGSGGFLGTTNNGVAGIIGVASCPPTLPDAGLAFGSELNAVYSYLDEPNNKLYFHITGNLKSSNEQHRLHLLFDAIAGEGQNAMRGDNVRVGLAEGGQGVINRLGNNGIDAGLTFDADFAADYYMVLHFEETNGARSVADSAVVRTNGRAGVGGGNAFSLDYGTFQGKPSGTLLTLDGSNFCCVGLDPGDIQRNGIRLQDDFTADIYSAYAPRESGLVLDAFRAIFAPFDLTVANWDNWINDPATAPRDGMFQAVMSNRNLIGVTDIDAAGAAGATEGMEIVIDLDELGWDGTSPIKVAGFIGNGDSTFLSNQVLGSLPDGAGNLGEPRLVNFDTISGTQYVVLTGTGGGFCDADWCQDGSVGVPDIFCFLSAWFANDPVARNYGGTNGVPAIFAFLSIWFATGTGPCVP